MKLTVRLFAGLRESVGASELEMDLPDGATVATALGVVGTRYPALIGILERTAPAVNMEYATRGQPLHDGDELALIPPVSGGEVPFYLVTDRPLDARLAAAAVRRDRHGAVLTFEGVVRDNASGKPTSYLEYDAYPAMAERVMRRIGEEVAARWGLDGVLIWHRVGRLEIGETSLLVVIGTPHRAEAFEAMRYCVDRIKQLVPVWKKEVGPDGSYWVEGTLIEVAEGT